MDPQEDLTDMDLTVQLPGGQETTATVHGSKPVMDVLVMLCAQHRLIPSDHVIKLISANQNHIHFKPNSQIGSLEFEKVVVKAKGSDDANRKKPQMPVATVRLMVNYRKSHKTVVRVNPRVPLADLMPSVCEKCEFNPDTTILLRTWQSEEPLDLTKTLNDYEIRELYAKDTKVISTIHSADPLSTKGCDEEQQKTPVKEKNQKEKRNKGFFGLFKKSKKTSEQVLTVSAPGSPELNNRRETCINGRSTVPAAPEDMSKKRRAPRPPLKTSQSISCESHTFPELSQRDTSKIKGLLSRISSAESSLKRTKRRAPPPPCDGPAPSDADNKENVDEDDDSSDKYRAHITDRCPAIADVMTELVKSLKARQQRALSSQTSATEESSAPHYERSAPEVEFKASPGCRLMSNSSEREGLTTFSVVPQRYREKPKCCEVELTLQASDTAEAEPDLNSSDPEDLEEVQTKCFRDNANASDNRKNLSEILQHLQNKNQVCKMENFEQKYDEQSIQTNNMKWGFNHLKSSELQDTKPDDLSIGERQEDVEEYTLVETSKEKNWIEEYKERRRKFLGGEEDDGKRKFNIWGKITKGFINKQIGVDDNFPSPPPPVCWYEDNREGENKSDMEMDVDVDSQTHDTDIDRWPNIESHFNQDVALNLNSNYEHHTPLSKPKAQSNPESNTSDDDYITVPDPPGISLTSRLSPSKSSSTSDPDSPESVSLFASAVFQKAKHFRPGPDANRFKSKR